MIPYSRPKLSDFYTLFKTNLFENDTLHSGSCLCSSYMVLTPSLGPWAGTTVYWASVST